MRAGISPMARVTEIMAATVLVLMAVMVNLRPDLVRIKTLKSRISFPLKVPAIGLTACFTTSCGWRAAGLTVWHAASEAVEARVVRRAGCVVLRLGRIIGTPNRIVNRHSDIFTSFFCYDAGSAFLRVKTGGVIWR